MLNFSFFHINHLVLVWVFEYLIKLAKTFGQFFELFQLSVSQYNINIDLNMNQVTDSAFHVPPIHTFSSNKNSQSKHNTNNTIDRLQIHKDYGNFNKYASICELYLNFSTYSTSLCGTFRNTFTHIHVLDTPTRSLYITTWQNITISFSFLHSKHAICW